jgi:hypothetical protein
MELARERARFAPGNLFPTFSMTDSQGLAARLADYQGKVLLVDFWSPGWTPWQRDLEYQISLYRRYQPLGLEVLGVAFGVSGRGPGKPPRSAQLPWRLVYGERTLTRELGIFGEATNFLLDHNGVIIGRNLRGADLAAAVQRALNTK